MNVSEAACCHSTGGSRGDRNRVSLVREREGLGSEFLEAIDKVVQGIAENPERFPIIRRDIRRALVHRFPYSILYRIVTRHVVVIACFHGKRNPKVWRSRR